MPRGAWEHSKKKPANRPVLFLLLSGSEVFALGSFFQQQRRRQEAFAVLLGQVLGPCNEVLHPVLVDELQRTAGPGSEADTED